ncbi:APC family permease [bacterium]|nr:APC family permease [bacterium]
MKENNFSRTLTKRNSLYLGLSSMIGAGLFYNLAPTSKISSYSSILGLLLASTLAFANASSSAQLASLYPQTGGTYLYANKVLGKLPGNIAGIVFILGKTVSCVAIALTLGNYISPIYGKELGVGLSVIVFLIGYQGITKTATLARWFVLIVISILTFFCIAILMTPSTNIAIPLLEGFSTSNLFLSAAIWFFAFTGYSRLATYGEEVKNPEKIIPSSILTGLGVTVTIYLLVNWLALAIIGPKVVANSNTPLLVAMDVSVMSDFSFLIVFASTIATASVFLALLPAISRIYVAMSRDGILPNVFSKIHNKNNSAYVSELFVLLTVVVGIYTINITNAIKLSAFFILIYYSLTNLSVINLHKNQRLYSVSIAYYGLLMCMVLGFSLVLI